MLIPFPPAVPEVPVSDIDRAVEYYTTVLGFQLDWGGDAGGICGVSQGDCRLFLTNPGFRHHSGAAAPIILWFNLNSREEVDELYRNWKQTGAKIVAEPEDKPWRLREFTATDVDANQLRVFYDFSRESPDREPQAFYEEYSV